MEPTRRLEDADGWADCSPLTPPPILRKQGQPLSEKVVSASEGIRDKDTSETGWKRTRAFFRWAANANIEVSPETMILSTQSVAASALATVGFVCVGLAPELVLPAAAALGLTSYGVNAFCRTWDIPHKIAAMWTLPVAALTLSSTIGTVGVLALTVAAGTYGPELGIRIGRVVGRIIDSIAQPAQ